MSRRRILRDFGEALAAAQALLADRGGAPTPPAGPARDTSLLPVVPPASAVPLPGLLEQCRSLLSEADAQPPPLRCLQHLACTGGTLIARCIAALPNTRVLSEVDPLSELGWPANRFLPTDVVGLARFGSRPPDRDVLIAAFLAGLGAVHHDGRRRGIDLVLRGHAHSQFHTRADMEARPTVPELLARAGPVRTVVTVRHPLQSYLALRGNGWVHFTPDTPEEYARRYHAFLDRHADLAWMRYEDFVADPDRHMAWLCDRLGLRHDPDFRQRLVMAQLSGDSGRRGDVIAPRPPRPCPEDVLQQAQESEAFGRLLDRLGYGELCTG